MSASGASDRLILNLGCGDKTSVDCVNIDWSPYLRLKSTRLVRRVAPLLMGAKRRERFESIAENIVVHDLRNGIPYADASVDVVYHSHMLEHMDRSIAPRFVAEVHRVLRPGGVHRVVVPDLEILARRYVRHLEQNAPDATEHEHLVSEMIEQMVRREAAVSRGQSPALRWVENIVRGDARARGETHQWMYDRITLRALLEQAGFVDVTVLSYDSSSIPRWHEIGLDRDASGQQYKPDSLYVEARRAT